MKNKEQELHAFIEFLKFEIAGGDPSPETIVNYTRHIEYFFEWCSSVSIAPKDANELDLKRYRKHLIEKEYSRATIAGRLNLAKRFFAMLVRNGEIAVNPAEFVKPPPERTERIETVKWLLPEEIQALLTLPDRSTLKGKRDRAILTVMVFHGLRVKEVTLLRREDLADDFSTLKVHGKGKKLRTVFLVDESKSALSEWIKVRERIAHEDRLFLGLQHNTGRGTAMSVRGVRQVVDSYLSDMGLKKKGISCHALRHSFATLAVAAGAKLEAVSQVLGHSSIVTTQIYADIVDREKENPAKYLSKMFGGGEKDNL